MISIDTNILVYAAIEINPLSKKSRDLINQVLNEGEVVLCWEVLYALRRISTNPVALSIPLGQAAADALVEEFIGQPNVRMISPSVDSWKIFKRYSQEMKLTGNLVSDAVIASQLEANGVKKLYSNDRDFRKFNYLRVIDPFAEKKKR
jgi:uncharacterized protein